MILERPLEHGQGVLLEILHCGILEGTPVHRPPQPVEDLVHVRHTSHLFEEVLTYGNPATEEELADFETLDVGLLHPEHGEQIDDVDLCTEDPASDRRVRAALRQTLRRPLRVLAIQRELQGSKLAGAHVLWYPCTQCRRIG